jgi:sulfatase-like protein
VSERAARVALLALCLLGPAVFVAKAVLRPEGDRFRAPGRVPAVPVVLATLASVSAYDVAAMPSLTGLLRRGTHFQSAISATNDDASALASILCGSLPRDHRVTRFGERAGDFPTLATELSRAGFETVAFLGSPLASGCGLERGFDKVLGGGSHRGAELVEELDRWIAERVRPRFFAWIDLRDAQRPHPDGRAAALAAADSALRALVVSLERRRIGGDVLLIVASDHGDDGAEAPPGERLSPEILRGVALLRFPYGELAGAEIPGSISAIDLAPTALELLKLTPPREWRGKGRLQDVQGMPSGPAMGGPFHQTGGPELWVAEGGPWLLKTDGDGNPRELLDTRTRTRRSVQPLPPEVLPLHQALRLAVMGLNG